MTCIGLGGIFNSLNQIPGSEYQVVLSRGRFESKAVGSDLSLNLTSICIQFIKKFMLLFLF